MLILIAEILIWAFLWAVLGLGVGFYNDGHAWQLIPILGAIYGIVAGSIYALLSNLYRLNRGQISLSIALLLSLFASILTIPALIMLTVEIKAASLIAIVAGPLSGIVVYLILRKKYHCEVNT